MKCQSIINNTYWPITGYKEERKESEMKRELPSSSGQTVIPKVLRFMISCLYRFRRLACLFLPGPFP